MMHNLLQPRTPPVSGVLRATAVTGQLLVRARKVGPATRPQVTARGVAGDVLGHSGFMDLARSVSGGGQQKNGPYKDLAYKIGKEVYLDIQGWHLFLEDVTVSSDVKMHQALAGQFGPIAAGITEANVEDLLKKVPLSLGGGKQKVSLLDALPSSSVRDLTEMVRESARN